jgi:surface-anchored protein
MNRTRRNGEWGLIALVAIACSFGISSARADGDVEGPWTLGHGDLSVTYSGTGSVFGFEVHLHTGAVVDGVTVTGSNGEHGAPAEITIVTPASANLKRIDNPTGFFEGGTGYDFTGEDFDATGAAVGGNLWMLGSSADAAHYETPFVGLSAEELVPAEWDGNISYVLQSVTFDGTSYGTSGGILSFFNESLQPLWSSQGGFTQIPISLIPGDGHVHGFFFFSQPGVYEMTLLASGSLADPAGPVSGTGTFRFEVVPEPSSILLAGLGLCATIGAGLRRRRAARSVDGHAG